MNKSTRIAALAAAMVWGITGLEARAADAGSLFLDAGGRAALWDMASGNEDGRRIAMGGGLGLAYGANESTELELRFDYHFIPPRSASSPGSAVEISDGELVSYFAPYHGDFRPMIGGHLGMVRVQDQPLRWSLGMDAMAVYDIQDRLQLYGSLTPSMLLGEGPGEIWMRMGAGVRARLGF